MAQSTLRRSKSVPDFTNSGTRLSSDDYFKFEFPTKWGAMTPAMMVSEYAELDGRYKEIKRRREEERKVFNDLAHNSRLQSQILSQNMGVVARLTWQLKYREHGILRNLPCFISCLIRPGQNRRYEFGEPERPDLPQTTPLSVAQRTRLRRRNMSNDSLCIICCVENICMVAYKCLHGSFCYKCTVAYIRDQWEQYSASFPGHEGFHTENQGPEIRCPICREISLGWFKVFL